VQTKTGVNEQETVNLLALLSEDSVKAPWAQATAIDAPEFESEPADGAEFVALPAAAQQARAYAAWSKALAEHLYRTRSYTLFTFAPLKLTSTPGEREGDFRARVRLALRERRDAELDALRAKYSPKLARADQQIDAARLRVEKEKSQYQQQQTGAAITFGASVLGALFGRKLASAANVGRAASAARAAGRTAQEKQDIARAEGVVQAKADDKAELEAELKAEEQRLLDSYGADTLEIGRAEIRPKKADVVVTDVGLVWTDEPPRTSA
jgi:hypothetical protein